MKVVFDANIFVSAAIQKGAPHRIVQTWLTGADFEVVICVSLVAELRDVLLTRLSGREAAEFGGGRERTRRLRQLRDRC